MKRLGGTLGVVVSVSVLPLTPAMAAQAASPTVDLTPSMSNEFLAPGDAVRLSFWREPDFNGDYPIDERGFAVLPLLGPRNLVRLRPLALKQQLLDEFARELRNQEVQITLLRRIRILGAVAEPGLFHVDPTMTFADAIALAGGVTSRGRLSRIEVYRGGNRIDTSIDLGAAIVGQLQSGDQITVPERSWMSRNGVFLLGALISATAIIISRATF